MAGPLLVLLALLALIPAFLVAAGILMAITGHLFVTTAESRPKAAAQSASLD